jgi:type II secretory pathway component PulF
MLGFAGSDVCLTPMPAEARGIGLNRDVSRACMVADALAWAVRKSIPLPDALRTLPFYKRVLTPSGRAGTAWRVMRNVLLPFNPFFWLMNIRWSWNLGLVIRDIEKGELLSSALERNCAGYFPGFYFMGIAKAEAENRLETALPVSARQLSYPASVASERKMEITFIAWKLVTVGYIVSFMIAAIAPRFSMIFSDLVEQELPYQGSFEQLVMHASVLVKGILLISLSILILAKSRGFGEYVLMAIPVVGRERRLFLVSDVARSMTSFLRQGEDVVAAAEWSIRSTRSNWMRKRLECFLESMRSGTRWDDAWIQIKVGTPLDDWLIKNSALRQDPASGFELMSQWAHQEVEFMTRRIERWADPVFTIVIALIVGAMAYSVFSTLISIVSNMSE